MEEFEELAGEAHVFESTGVVLGGEEVVAVGKVEALANVFEGVGVGPDDADRFFGEGEDLFLLGVEFVLGQDPGELVGHEVLREVGGAIYFY